MTTVAVEFRHFRADSRTVGFWLRLVTVAMTLDVEDKAAGGQSIVYRWNRDTCVNVMEQLTDTGEPIMTAC